MNIKDIIRDRDFISWLNNDSGIYDYQVNEEWLVEQLYDNPSWAEELYREYLDIDLIVKYEW